MRLTRSIRASAAPAVLTCMALAIMAVPALAREQMKPCTHIGGCSTVVRTPVLSQGTEKPPPMSHFGVMVKTAPTSTVGTADQQGTIVTNPLPGHRISCTGYSQRSDSTLLFQLRTATPLHINYVVTDRVTNTTTQGIEFCLATPLAFKTLSGRPAAPTKLPDGTPGFVGLLPGCAKVPDTAPCLISVTTAPDPTNSSTKVDVILKARVPATTKGSDPWAGP